MLYTVYICAPYRCDCSTGNPKGRVLCFTYAYCVAAVQYHKISCFVLENKKLKHIKNRSCVSSTVGLKPRLYDTTCCQTGCQTGLTTGLTTGCIVYTAGCQTVAVRSTGCQTGCQTGLLTTGLTNRFDNRLDVCSHDTAGCRTGCTTRLTTGCIV